MGRFIVAISSLAVLLQVVVCNGDQARALQDQALSAPVICPLRPCILPADCKLIIPSDPEDPCACPTCALDCSTVLCALPTHCPNPVTPEGQCCPVCPVTKPTDSPIDCNLVDCAVPDCPNPVVPEGQCCPVCPVTRLARALQDQALSAPVICPLRPCILPADCKLIIPSDPEDPCACPTCALDCSTVLCALPTHCPNPVTPEGQCCPVCPVTKPTDSPIDCNLVDCAVPDCPNPVVPEGQCCPVCPNPPIDCNLVDCAVPDCLNPVIPEGHCCPICPTAEEPTESEQSCPIEGQVFMKCGTACPPTCAEPSPRFCTLQCVVGCQCPAGTVLDEVANKCVPLEECTCPPDCARDFCVNNPRARCNIPGPREIPGCFGQCQPTFCPACYFSDEVRDLPGSCRDCGSPVTSTSCLRGWSKCIHKADIRENGKPEPSSLTQEKFKCYRYPCQLRG